MAYISTLNKTLITRLTLFKNICGIPHLTGYMSILAEVDRIGKGLLNHFELIFTRHLL